MICKHVNLTGKTESGVKTACGRTESAVIIADTVGAFAFHVLTLYNEFKFKVQPFVEFTPLSLNLVVQTCTQDFNLEE